MVRPSAPSASPNESATGRQAAVAWMMLARCVSSKSSPWISTPLTNAASRSGSRSARPITLTLPSPPSAMAPATAASEKP